MKPIEAGPEELNLELLSVKQVASCLGVCTATVWNWVRHDAFPKPIPLGQLRRWRKVDIEQHLHRREFGKAANHE